MTLKVNGELIDESEILQEAERMRPRYEQTFADMEEQDREEQLMDWSRENVIERMLVLSPIDAQVIGPDQLPSDLVDGPGVTVAVREEVLTGSKSLSEAVDEFERDIIGEALNRTHYNQTRAANVLGTTRRILKYRMDKLGIDGDPIL